MTPPILLNENFPAPSTRRLREAGFDLFSIAERCASLKDVEVLAIAVNEKRWLITFDRDYGELLFARRFPPPPAVILLRVPSYRPEEPADWVINLTKQQQECLGRFTVFDGETIRSRPLLSQVIV